MAVTTTGPHATSNVKSLRYLLAASLAALVVSSLAGTSRAQEKPLNISNAGFALPESVLYDAATDVYLVSNINGTPLDGDDNGFVSRVSPNGEVLVLKWIDGARADVRLDAPKGMAISGGTLWIADISVIRRFDAKTGKQLDDVKIDSATFLNGVAPAADGGVFVSDSGLNADFSPSGTDAVYHIDKTGALRPLARTEALGRPNGVRARPDGGVWVVTFGTAELYEVSSRGERKGAVKLPAGQLDGIIALDDGNLLISSWEGEGVYRGRPNGGWTKVISGLKSPGDIGWDSKRRRLLVPLVFDSVVQIHPLP